MFGSLKGSLQLVIPGKEASAFAGICEGKQNAGKARNETMIEVDHAKETLESFDIHRLRKGENGLDTAGERRKARRCDLVAQAIHLRDSKDTLIRIIP